MLLYNFFKIVLNKLCKCLYLPKLKINSINTKFKLVFYDEKPNWGSTLGDESKTGSAVCGSLSRG